MPVFIIVILASLLLLNILWALQADYLLRRRDLGWRARIWAPSFAAGMCILLAAYFWGRGADIRVREFIPSAVVILLYLWHLVVLPLWLVFTPVVALGAFISARQRRRESVRSKNVISGEREWTRRRFIGALGVAAPPVALLGLGAASLPGIDRFRIRRLELAIDGLPAGLDGLTIAQVSDAHVGPFTYGKTLREIARTTNDLRADIILLTGDLINDDIDDLPAALDMVRQLDAGHGVFLCEGNHDLIPGPTKFTKRTKAAGINLLVNEEETIEIRGERLQLLGLRWGSGGEDRTLEYSDEAIARSMDKLLTLRDPEAFPILMAHHPHAFDPAAAAGLPLVLAGHTHGGQLMINEDLGFGPALFRYWTGIYRKEGSTLAVSNGVGNWFPLRTAAPAEILHLTLRRPAH